MDIFSHGLWSVASSKVIQKKRNKPVSAAWAFWWGVFPDLFAFTPIFVWTFWERINGHVVTGMRPVPGQIEPWVPGTSSFSAFTQLLYSFSHSLVIFALVYFVVYLLRRRRHAFVMFGWGLHILMDIPTHTYRFYATPFLWPISNVKVSGISWGQLWFMILNYSLILFTFILIHLYKKKSQ